MVGGSWHRKRGENARVTAVENRATSLAALTEVQDRVLWLAMSIVHHANRVRKTPSGVKVGGHQASSASMVSIMTALWFEHLRAAGPGVGQAARLAGAARDRVPARCSSTRKYLTTLREFGGLQSYPSRLKDPDPGRLLDRLGRHRRDRHDLERDRSPLRRRALRGAPRRAPGGAARRRRARRGRLLGGDRRPGRSPHLGEVLWIVDLNRQSLDRIVPDIAAGRIDVDVRAPPAGRRSRSSTGAGCTSCSRATGGECAAASGSTRCPTRSTSGCCGQTPTSCASACPGSGRGSPRADAADRRARRRRVAAGDPRPRRPRPRRAARGVRRRPTRSATARR